MSTDLNVFCQDYKNLQSQEPPRDASCFSAGVLGAVADLVMAPLRHEEAEDLFSYLDFEYDLDDPGFEELRKQERVAIGGKKAVKYLSVLLKLLEGPEVPPVYCFAEAGGDGLTADAFFEDGSSMASGFDFCVVREGAKTTDVRRLPEVTVHGRRFSVVRQSVLEFAGNEFRAMLKVAKTCQDAGKKLVLEMS